MNENLHSDKIVVIGSSNVDMVVKTDRHPLPGETRLGGIFFMNAGGKGANQAVAAARLGGNVTLVTKVGNDIFGKQTIAGLRRENINTDYVFVDESAASGTALIVVNKDGENSIVVAPGANANLLPADIDKVKDIAAAEITSFAIGNTFGNNFGCSKKSNGQSSKSNHQPGTGPKIK